jgi:hypothetical protein
MVPVGAMGKVWAKLKENLRDAKIAETMKTDLWGSLTFTGIEIVTRDLGYWKP